MNCLGSPLRRALWILLLVSLTNFCNATITQNSLSVYNLNFGSVQVGSSSTMPVTVSNTLSTNLVLAQISMSNSNFSFVGPTLPITLAPRQTVQLSILFAPKTTGSITGTGTIACNWGTRRTPHHGNMTANLSGIGVAPGYLSVPSGMNLGSVMVGSSQTQSLTLTNTGGASLIISSATVNSSSFTFGGLTFPYTLSPGAGVALSVTFSPSSAGTVNASLSLTSNASNPFVSVALTGVGTSPNGTLGVTPGSVNFGTVTIGNTPTQNGSLAASGGSVTVTSATSSNALFTLSGFSLPLTIPPGESVPFTLKFAPASIGAASANISFFTSNSTSVMVTASGSGATIQHIVDLYWNPSTSSSVTGYNIYRAATSTGPFSKINAGLNSSLSYTDSSVASGQTYYYAATAVDSAGVESSYSNKAQAVIPFP